MAKGQRIHYLKTAEMFGFQNLAEQSGAFMDETWKFDVMAETDGAMAIIPYGEVKAEIRRQPKTVSIYKTNYNGYFMSIDV